jgi:hypothetical protein
MNIAISQPRYLPALGFLQRLSYVDLFVVYDTVQRQPRAWENRNKLLLPDPTWLTVPIISSSREILSRTLMDNSGWIDDHINKIKHYHNGSNFYDAKIIDSYYYPFREAYINGNLSFTTAAINAIEALFNELSLPFKYVYSSALMLNYAAGEDGAKKLVKIAEKCQGTTYLSGENGREYGVSNAFKNSKCTVKYHKYSDILYKQIGDRNFFIPHLGFFDPLFCVGREKFCEFINEMPVLLD